MEEPMFLFPAAFAIALLVKVARESAARRQLHDEWPFLAFFAMLGGAALHISFFGP
jgi:hypothetical protein